ncbi:hypothetical protein J2790_002837 [Paenarthrobacter nicotinovorans]|nr:hypothetical protein [Paenarthrobacter nicotinovorans]SCZ61147.1 hypothetical protein SAMN02799638_03120 [Arthrobacter sp. UNCCL28]
MNSTRSVIPPGTRSWWGGTNSAEWGEFPRIQTCEVRYSPAMTLSDADRRVWCIAPILSTLRSSDSAMAACIASTLEATREALILDLSPNCASTIFRAPAVKFSIWELDADSLLSSKAANGVESCPSSASKRTISIVAVSTKDCVAESTPGSRSEIAGGTAASYGPLASRRCRLDTPGAGSVVHGRCSKVRGGQSVSLLTALLENKVALFSHKVRLLRKSPQAILRRAPF